MLKVRLCYSQLQVDEAAHLKKQIVGEVKDKTKEPFITYALIFIFLSSTESLDN